MKEIKVLDTYPEESVCPLCKEEADIEFDSGSVDDAGFTYYCTCGNCGAKTDLDLILQKISECYE